MLFFIGILLLMAGLIVKAYESGQGGSRFGGVLFIGPFPLVFGSSPEITSTMFFTGAAILGLYMFFGRRKR